MISYRSSAGKLAAALVSLSEYLLEGGACRTGACLRGMDLRVRLDLPLEVLLFGLWVLFMPNTFCFVPRSSGNKAMQGPTEHLPLGNLFLEPSLYPKEEDEDDLAESLYTRMKELVRRLKNRLRPSGEELDFRISLFKNCYQDLRTLFRAQYPIWNLGQLQNPDALVHIPPNSKVLDAYYLDLLDLLVSPELNFYEGLTYQDLLTNRVALGSRKLYDSWMATRPVSEWLKPCSKNPRNPKRARLSSNSWPGFVVLHVFSGHFLPLLETNFARCARMKKSLNKPR